MAVSISEEKLDSFHQELKELVDKYFTGNAEAIEFVYACLYGKDPDIGFGMGNLKNQNKVLQKALFAEAAGKI